MIGHVLILNGISGFAAGVSVFFLGILLTPLAAIDGDDSPLIILKIGVLLVISAVIDLVTVYIFFPQIFTSVFEIVGGG